MLKKLIITVVLFFAVSLWGQSIPVSAQGSITQPNPQGSSGIYVGGNSPCPDDPTYTCILPTTIISGGFSIIESLEFSDIIVSNSVTTQAIFKLESYSGILGTTTNVAMNYVILFDIGNGTFGNGATGSLSTTSPNQTVSFSTIPGTRMVVETAAILVNAKYPPDCLTYCGWRLRVKLQ